MLILTSTLLGNSSEKAGVGEKNKGGKRENKYKGYVSELVRVSWQKKSCRSSSEKLCEAALSPNSEKEKNVRRNNPPDPIFS